MTRLSSEAVEQIYLVRIELEGMAVKFAKQHMRLTDVDELQGKIEEMRTAARNDDRVSFCRADFEFHRSLWEFSGNPYLVKALDSIAAPLFSYLLIESFRVPGEDMLALAEQHQQMLNLIRNESAEDAAAGVRQLLQKFHDLSTAKLRQINPEFLTTESAKHKEA